MSRLEAGTMSLEQEPCHFGEILSEAMPQLVALCQNHELQVEAPQELPWVMVDSRRIVQVVANLVENACKYSPANTPVEISARTHNGFVQVNVRDYGQGIPLEEREAVFQAFQQAANRPQRETRGAGLGLAIAKRLVESHGGTIWIADHDDPGTTVSFTLPRAWAGRLIYQQLVRRGGVRLRLSRGLV